MSHILVAYATRNGSTQQVAEAIGTVAIASGEGVRVAPLSTLRGPLTGWDLVVVGAPIYNGRWHRDAHRFLRRHRAELARLPVAVFGMGPRRDDAEAWRRSRTQLDRALAKHAWLTPLSVGLFGGVDPARRVPRERRDLRDWSEIATWAAEALARSAPAHA